MTSRRSALGSALDHYAQTTNLPALVPSGLIRGRMSSPVRGRYPPEVALQMLPAGTGLMASGRSSNLGRTFVLQEGGGTGATADGMRLSALFADGGHAGLGR